MSTLQEEDRLLIKDAVDKFIQANYPFEEKEKRHDQFGKFGGNWGQFVELGWTMLPFPEDSGGLGGGAIDAQVLLSAFGRGLIAEPYAEVVLLAGKVVEYCAQPERREELLMSIMSGEQKLIVAHGEKLHGLRFIRTSCKASRHTGGYSLSGKKTVVLQATAADHFLVTAKLDGKPALFLVPKDAKNLKISEYTTIDSRYAADINLDNVALDSENLIAAGPQVETGVRRALLFTLACLMGEVQGIAENTRKLTAAYMKTRTQFGTRIADFQALQHMLADMVIAEEEIKALATLASDSVDSNNTDFDELERVIRTAKARIGKVSRTLVETAVQLHGGIGVTDEMIVSHYLRRVVAIDAFYGDTEQQLIWLAQQY